MHDHSSCLLLYDQVNPGAALDLAGRRQFAEIVLRLCRGSQTDRYSAKRASASPLVCLIRGRTSVLTRLSSIAPDTLPDVTGHLITIPTQVSAQFGVFDKLPNGFADTGRLIRQLDSASTEFFGTPIRAFLSRLMKEGGNPRGLARSRVYRCIEKFVNATGVDRNDGAALRVARTFGLIYAAGYLAQIWGILPSNWKIAWAVINCYRAHLTAAGAMPRSAIAFDRILDYVRRHRHEFIDLRSGKKRIDDATFAKAWGFLKVGLGGTLELYIPPPRMHLEFPDDYVSLMRELRGQGRARVEGGKQPKLTTKADICGPGSGDRVYCIILGSAASMITEDSVRPFDLDPPPH